MRSTTAKLRPAARSKIVNVMTYLFMLQVLGGCAGYVPGRQSYWDAQLEEMCKKDGGVQIVEQVRVTPTEVKQLGRVDGRISVPMKESARASAPLYTEEEITYIRKEGNPQVWRTEYSIVRRVDQAIVARWVIYTRTGGDLPSLAHPSSIVCPALNKITADLQQLFIVVEQ